MKNKWFLAYKKRGDDLFDMSGFTIVEPPHMTYQADPFLFRKGNKRCLFIEDYDYMKGKISVYDVDDSGPHNLRTAIEEAWHMSYPFLFEHDGQTWMVPETGWNGKIDLYRCLEFPDKWTRIKTLIHKPGFDSTLIGVNDKIWLFTTHGDLDELSIYCADDLLGEWRLFHKGKYTHSRSAGKIFSHDFRLIRPTQDCSACYGHAIVFKEIQMSEDGYKEKVYKRVEPTWAPGLIGTHTFSFDDDYVYIDGKVEVND